MSLFYLNNELIFPSAELAEPDGLLAVGGDLSVDRILLAYRNGIFPWYEGEHILWWSPNPRCVLYPQQLKVSTSMRQLIKKKKFEFTTDTAFPDVIHQCSTTPRRHQNGTWITDEIIGAYTQLFAMGYAHSAEAWYKGELAGGLYGVLLGPVFFGESMFSHLSNASKYAFIQYVNFLTRQNIKIIDCQIYTEHLTSLGARMITRKDFIAQLNQLLR